VTFVNSFIALNGKGGKAKADAPNKNAEIAKMATKFPRTKGTTPRAESNAAKILELIGRTQRATLAEIMKGDQLAGAQ